MTSWHSYPKIWNLGHRAIEHLLEDTSLLVVEEKMDGSQFSLGRFNGELKCRSKGAELNIDAPEKMFTKAVETAKELLPLLQEGWTYRGEYLSKPKHNSLAYERVPAKNIILFDVNTEEETYLSYNAKDAEAKRLGLEVVPCFSHRFKTLEDAKEILETISILGGQKIEGFVVKNYGMFGRDGKVLMGKHVSEAFKEVHATEWKKSNPTNADILELLGNEYRTPARWNKAIQHLLERGQLTDSPKDIGPLIKETQKDIEEECVHEIKEKLYSWAKQHVLR